MLHLEKLCLAFSWTWCVVVCLTADLYVEKRRLQKLDLKWPRWRVCGTGRELSTWKGNSRNCRTVSMPRGRRCRYGWILSLRIWVREGCSPCSTLSLLPVPKNEVLEELGDFKLWILYSQTENLVLSPVEQCGNSKITYVGKMKIIFLSFFFILHF